MSLGGRRSDPHNRARRRAEEAERRAHEAMLQEFDGTGLPPIARWGLGRTSRGGKSVAGAAVERATSRWPEIGLAALWITAVWRIVGSMVATPVAWLGVVWSALILAAAIVATIAWWRAGVAPDSVHRGRRRR